jgi:hypothetical protein
MKRFSAAIVVAAACAAGLSTDAVAQADTPPAYDYLRVGHPQGMGMMCDGPDMNM